MLMRRNQLFVAATGAGLAALGATQAHAVAYASGITDLGGGNFQFVLNEDADNVKVELDASTLDLGALAFGKHTFNVGGSSTWSIDVSQSTPVGWTLLDSGATNPFLDFENPRGLAVNTSPSSPYFGTIYVGNARDLPTAQGRPMGDGLYAIAADGTDQFGETDPNAVVAAVPGTSDFSGSTVASPWRMAVGVDGTVYTSDWSDGTGGIKWATPDLSNGGALLDQQSGPTGGVTNTGGQPIHGSIVGLPNPTGSFGSNLSILAMDEDLEGLVPGTGNHIWRWDINAATGDFDGAPTLVVDSTALGTHTDGNPIHLDLNIGVTSNAYEADNGLIYIFQPRNDGNESGLIVIDPSVPIGTDDNSDGISDQVLWSSKQFAIDNGWDSFPDDPGIATSAGNNDVLRNVTSGAVSPDGTKLFVKRRLNSGDDVFAAGQGSFLVIPLDANGVPVIVVDDNNTPADPSDDFFANVEDIAAPGDGPTNFASELAVDAAGNVYLSSNVAESVSVFTPGGAFLASTTSAGTFSLTALAAGILGDYNDSGLVEQGDLDQVLSNWGAGFASIPASWINQRPTEGIVDQAELDVVLTQWGSSSAPDFAGSNVPEPATLAVLGGLALVGLRRRS